MNRLKHNVNFEEAITVFDDPFALYFEDSFHSDLEYRFIVRGYSNNNRLLIVYYTMRKDTVRLISARSASKNERKQHERRD